MPKQDNTLVPVYAVYSHKGRLLQYLKRSELRLLPRVMEAFNYDSVSVDSVLITRERLHRFSQ